MLRIAMAHWQGRVSPVFDVSDALLLIDIDRGQELRRLSVSLHCSETYARAREVAGHGIAVLICGAISRPLETALGSAGVQVCGFVCGPLDEVLAAFLQGGLRQGRCRMPGCGGRMRRRGRGGRGDRDTAR